MKNSQLIRTLAVLAGSLALGAQAQVTIGGWQGSSSDGWIDWGNSASITDPANASKYSFVSGAVSGYSQSLKITQAGWNQGLALKLEYYPSDMQAFFDNHLLSFTFSVPDAASSGSSAGWSQLYAFTINASGLGFQNISWTSPSWSYAGSTGNNSSGMPNFYFYNGAPVRSQTVTLDYSSLLPSITATPSSGYVEFIFTSNTGGGAPNDFYMNDVTLSGGLAPQATPEPGCFALLGLGAAMLLFRRRANG